MAPSTLVRIEKGELSPSVATLGAIAKALDVEARRLLARGWPVSTKRIRRKLSVLLALTMLGGAAVVPLQGEVRSKARINGPAARVRVDHPTAEAQSSAPVRGEGA